MPLIISISIDWSGCDSETIFKRALPLPTFLLLILITNLGRAFVTYLGIKLSYVCSSQVCQKVYKKHLEQDYLDFLSSNSSELISIVTTKVEILSTRYKSP